MRRPDAVTILLVEDDDVEAEAIMRGFRGSRIGNPIVHAEDGLEALARLRGESGHEHVSRPYVILLDLNMPRMGGLEFLEAVRADERLRDSIVFVLTTSDNDRDRTRAYEKNVAGYMVKSDVGPSFRSAIEMLGHYWVAVELPA